jgi:hypothetical protein
MSFVRVLKRLYIADRLLLTCFSQEILWKSNFFVTCVFYQHISLVKALELLRKTLELGKGSIPVFMYRLLYLLL